MAVYKGDSRSFQLCSLDNRRKKFFEERLQCEFNNQFEGMPTMKVRKIIKRAIANIAILHLAMNDEKQIKAPLNDHADFPIRNSLGHAAVLQNIKENKLHFYKVGCESRDFYALYKYKEPVSHQIRLVMLTHVKYNDSVNSKGIPDLRVACMLTNPEVGEVFLKNEISFNKTVNLDLKILFGYPSLHFAAEHSIVDAAKVLLAKGAQVHSKDVEGRTPLEILIAQSMEIIDSIRMGKGSLYKELVNKLKKNQSIIEMILKAISKTDEVELASTKKQKEVTSFDTQLWIKIRKSFWRGYTALPFNLYINVGIASVRKVKSSNDTKETTISFTSLRSFVEDYSFLENQSDWKNIRFSDNKTSLAEFQAAMKDSRSFEEFMKKIGNNVSMFIPHDSSVLPGCTLLHLTIIFAAKMDYDNIIRTTFDFKNKSSNKSYNYTGVPRRVYIGMMKHCLELGADVTVPNSHGTTPLELAAKLLGERVVWLLQQFQIANISRKDSDAIQKSPSNPHDPTTMHPAVHDQIIKLRVQLGLKAYNTSEQQQSMDKFHKDNPDSFYRVVEEFASKKNPANVTALHAACCKLDVDRVEKYLLTEDANVRTKPSNAFWAGFTPLHFLTMKRSTCDMAKLISIARLLLEKGADVTLKNAYGFTPVHQALDNVFLPLPSHRDKQPSEFIEMLLRGTREFNVNPADPRGISHLHIACFCNQADLVEKFAKSGADINQKINNHSNSYMGFTPLHLAARYKHTETLDLLLKLGADVHVTNRVNNTPLHEASNFLRHSKKFGYEEKSEDVVQKLVRAGANVEAENLYGQIPLEMLLETKVVTTETFEMLLKDPSRVNLFNHLSGVGLIGVAMMFTYDIDSLEIHPVYQAMKSNPKKNQADLTHRTPIHNIVAMRNYSNQYTLFKLPPFEVFNEGITSFVKLGFDVDQQDRGGQTALHVAERFLNAPGIEALLSHGSDVNIVNINGFTPPSRCLERSKHPLEFKLSDKAVKQIAVYKLNCLNAFFKHIHKMKLAGLHINEINDKVYTALQKQMSIDENFDKKCQDELSMLLDKKNDSGCALYLGGFFVKLDQLVPVYKKLKPAKRLKVDEVFQNVGKNYPEYAGLLRMQYRHLQRKADVN